MTERMQYLSRLSDFEFDTPTSNSGWLHVMTPGTVHHPVYGTFDLTPERIQKFADNVNNNVLGTQVPIDFSHGRGPDGERAAGWSTQADARDSGLWCFVDWTPRAAGEIRNGEWKYSSAEFTDHWTDQQGHQHDDVLLAAAITNRPFLKDLSPINLMEFEQDLELMEEEFPEHFELAADTSTWDGNAAMTACKSASDYRAVCAGRRAGDPSERQTWALPHHKSPGAPPNKGGVAAALQRFSQTQGLVNKDGAMRHLKAHQNAISSMGGDMDSKVLASFFGLPEDAADDQILDKAKELGEFFQAKATEEEKVKTFAEQFPEQFEEMQDAKRELADLRNATRLSEINHHITKLTEGGKYGLPPAVIDDLRAVRSELTTEADAKLATVFDTIIETGLVQFGEQGAGTHVDSDEITLADAIKKYQSENEGTSYAAAYEAVSKSNPDLVREYVGKPKGGE